MEKVYSLRSAPFKKVTRRQRGRLPSRAASYVIAHVSERVLMVRSLLSEITILGLGKKELFYASPCQLNNPIQFPDLMSVRLSSQWCHVTVEEGELRRTAFLMELNAVTLETFQS